MPDLKCKDLRYYFCLNRSRWARIRSQDLFVGIQTPEQLKYHPTLHNLRFPRKRHEGEIALGVNILLG